MSTCSTTELFMRWQAAEIAAVAARTAHIAGMQVGSAAVNE